MYFIIIKQPVVLIFHRYFLLALFMTRFFVANSQSEITVGYDGTDTLAKSIAIELSNYLERACKKNIHLDGHNNSRPGCINLKTISDLQTSLMKEGFILKGNGKTLDIFANHFNGLRNGVYYYLNLLGFRFYLPGDIWTHIPNLRTPFLEIDTTIYPPFANRAMFPTGGFRKNLAVDPNNLFQKDWNHWLSQNLYSSEEKIDGHMGEAFNNKYKKELLGDTMMLAEVKGRRQWSASVKWCISNSKLVELFVKDRVEAFEKMKENFPDRNLISVEPADGYGDCECDNCKKMGTVSDRYFYLANKAAEAIEKKWRDGGVSLFAYNTHAAVPSITLESNVFVMVTPYRFQNITEPAVLLNKWKEKTGNIGVYDYWCITDACLDLPIFNYLQKLPGKYKLWSDLHLKGFLLETGYSKFNNALAFYFFSRMIWFKETDLMRMLRKFCDENFGKAAPVIFTMLERWGINFKTRFEVPVSLEEIKRAYSLEKDPTVQKRLDEVKAVLVYAALEDNAVSNLSKSGAEERVDNLFRYIWSVYDYRIINTGVIHNLVRRKIIATKKDVTTQWNLADALKNKQFWDEAIRYKLPSSLPETITNPLNLSSQTPVLYPLSDEKNIDSIFSKNKKFFENDPVKFRAQLQMEGSVLSGSDGIISLDIEITEPFKNQEKIPVVALYDERGFFIEYKEIEKQNGRQDIRFSGLLKNKRYKVSVYANSNFEIEIPNRIFLLDGENIGTLKIQLLSTQQPVLMFAGNYNYYIDAYRYNGRLTDEKNKVVLSKTKKTAKRTAITQYRPGTPFLQIVTKAKDPFVVEVVNGKTLYGFSNN